MNHQIDISVIIPCHNDGIYIQEALDSLNAQTYQKFEIIIVDDASTDLETLKILATLEQENLQVIFLEQNSGPSVARNIGISKASGKYILPLDADDKIAPTYLEKAKNILDKDPNIGIVYCEADFFGQQMGKWDLPPYSFPEILTGNMIFATAMYRKEDWKSVSGYNESMRHGNEDYDFWLSLLELKRDVYRINEVLFFYRIKKNSRTTKLFENQQILLDSYRQIYHNHKKLFDSHKEFIFLKLVENEQRHNQLIQEKSEEIHETNRLLYHSTTDLREKLSYATSIVELRDQQIQDLLEQSRLRHVPKRIIKKLLPSKVWNTLKVINNKIALFKQKTSKEISKDSPVYLYDTPKLTREIEEEISSFKEQPLISIIMPVYNVDPKWLKLAIQSIENQWYDNWELCIADDKSTDKETINCLKNLNNPKIKVKFLEKNLNISGASNAAIELASGEYIALMDNDDEITPDALYEMVKAINEQNAEFIYSDEDFMTEEGECTNPHFKPDFSPDLLLSHNYITHFTCFKSSLLDKVGNFNSEFDGSQDYDLFLRLTEKTSKIYHIQKVLYHWRMLESSTSANSEAKPEAIERGKKVLESALARRNIDATVEYGNLNHYFRVKYTIDNNPLVSIVIPFKDKPELLNVCINSILEKSTYQNFEIIGISNNSKQKETFDMMAFLEKKDSRVSFYEYNIDFNYAKINNYAVNTYAKGQHILLLNNDIEIITPEWIESMLEHSQRDKVGCVGAKLYYPNDTVQHAGIIIGLGGYAGHSHKMYPRDNPGYFNRLNVVQNVSAVTAACLMVKKELYTGINGMDEVNFKIAYNDVDFCLRVIERGYRNIFTPYAQMYHHESVTRGYETTPEKKARFKRERNNLGYRHNAIIKRGDPYYNPNLTLDIEDFSLCKK